MACEAQETASPAAPMNEPAAAGEDSNSPATAPSEDPTVDPSTTTSPQPPVTAELTANELIPRISLAICGALDSCCNDDHFIGYFDAFAQSPRIAEAGLVSTLPPAVPMDSFDCESALTAALEVQPFGPWVDAVNDGLVTFHADEAVACLEALETAACGDEFRDAIFDSTCFAFAAPMSSQAGRRMFTRTAPPGATCTPLSDGVGGAIYGTCDPAQSWCCRKNEAGACGLAEGVEGTCEPAGSLGSTCGLVPVMQFCKTGLTCGYDTCEEEGGGDPLSLGETCYDSSGLTGYCEDSWCDLFGSTICEPLKADGAACLGAYECIGGACENGICGLPTFCGGL